MKVFFIENENPGRNSSGGIMTYLINLSRYLMKHDVETTLVGQGNPNNSNNDFCNFYSISRSEADISNFRFFIKLFLSQFRLSINRGAIIHVQRPDNVMAILFVALIKRCNIVCSLHGCHDVAVYDKKGGLWGLFYSLLQFLGLLFSNKVIAVDRKTMNHYLKKMPWLRSKIKTIPIGVDLNKYKNFDKNDDYRKAFNIESDSKVLVFVGRLEKEKNIQFLINVFQLVYNNQNNTYFIIVGDGRERKLLESMVSKSNIPNIIFTGEVDNQQVSLILYISNVFVFSSFYEGSPTVIKEALASGLSIVSVDVGDVAEVLFDIDGCFICERNIEIFAEKVIEALDQKNIDRKYLACFAEKYSIEKVNKCTYEFYNML